MIDIETIRKYGYNISFPSAKRKNLTSHYIENRDALYFEQKCSWKVQIFGKNCFLHNENSGGEEEGLEHNICLKMGFVVKINAFFNIARPISFFFFILSPTKRRATKTICLFRVSMKWFWNYFDYFLYLPPWILSFLRNSFFSISIFTFFNKIFEYKL